MRTLEPEIGISVHISTKTKAIQIIAAPPNIHDKIAAGPAYCPAKYAANSQPEPRIALTDESSKLNVDIDLFSMTKLP